MINSLLVRWGVKKPKDGLIERFGVPERARLRVLFVANALIPTLTLSYLRPLGHSFENGDIAAEVLSEKQIKAVFGKNVHSRGASLWLARRFARFAPDVVVFCRYSGPLVEQMIRLARHHQASTFLQLDDDLLHVPVEFGAAKYAFHNAPERLFSLRYLLKHVDRVYFSNDALKERYASEDIGGACEVARVFAASEVLRPPVSAAEVKIGYMGIDHARDLELVTPALVRILKNNPEVSFELFGPMQMPGVLADFGPRARSIAAVHGYDAFLDRFASLEWAIGICPLQNTPFNQVKSDLKWVEYTAVGAAVVASAGLMYEACCAGGCGLLAVDDESWEGALQQLIDDPGLRLSMVAKAQERLRSERSLAALRLQLQEMFERSRPAMTVPLAGRSGVTVEGSAGIRL